MRFASMPRNAWSTSTNVLVKISLSLYLMVVIITMPTEIPLIISDAPTSDTVSIEQPKKGHTPSIYHIIIICGIFLLQVLIVIFLSIMVSLVTKEINYARTTLSDLNLVMSEVDEMLPHTRQMVLDVSTLHDNVHLNLEILLRFCRSPDFTSYCLLPVPDDYEYNVTHAKFNMVHTP